MGTNYYMYLKEKKLAAKLSDHYVLTDDPDFGYSIHLGKTSFGWKPLMEVQRGYHTFKKLEHIVLANDNIKIYNEYGEWLTWQEYKDTVVDHSRREPEPCKWNYRTDEVFNPNRKSLYLDRCDPAEAEIWTPFSHAEYQRTYNEAKRKFGYSEDYIFHEPTYQEDPNYNFDWVEGDFS